MSVFRGCKINPNKDGRVHKFQLESLKEGYFFKLT